MLKRRIHGWVRARMSSTPRRVIEDLQQLLQDIQLKIVDMKEMKATSVERLQQAAKVPRQESKPGVLFSTDPTGPASVCGAVEAVRLGSSMNGQELQDHSVSGTRPRQRPRAGWMDCVKRALDARGN